MSGAEALAVLGAISAVVSLIDETKKVYDAASHLRGLPGAFREVADRLPIVTNILHAAREEYQQTHIDESSCAGAKPVLDACEQKARRLNDLFIKALPKDGASGLRRYYQAVKVCGKGNEVENLMKGILEDLQLLACDHGLVAAKVQQEQITLAITELSAVTPSVPEHLFQESSFTATNTGPGTQYNAHGENIAQGNARQYNSAGGTMNFGKE